MNKVRARKIHSSKSFGSYFRLFLRRILFAALLISMVTPAMAGITKLSGNMMMDMSIPVEASIEQDTCGEATDMLCHHMGKGMNHDQVLFSATSTDIPTTISAEMDCEQECNCCPGVCSAYLPVEYSSSAFLPEKTLLNTIIMNAEAVTTATLFRPPISH